MRWRRSDLKKLKKFLRNLVILRRRLK